MCVPVFMDYNALHLIHINDTYLLDFGFTFCDFSDMSATTFIETLPVIEFVTQLLNSEIHFTPLSDAEQVKVFSLNLPFPDISSHRKNQCSNEMLCMAFNIKMYNPRWLNLKLFKRYFATCLSTATSECMPTMRLSRGNVRGTS